MTNRVILLIPLLLFLTNAAPAQLRAPQESAVSRFLRYVTIDTQSTEDQKQVHLIQIFAEKGHSLPKQ